MPTAGLDLARRGVAMETSDCALWFALLTLIAAWVEIRLERLRAENWRRSAQDAAMRISWLEKRRGKA